MRRTAVLRSSLLPCAALLMSAAAGAHAQSFRPLDETEPRLAGFGAAIAIGENEVFIGEPRNSMRPGIVYVYRRDASGTWAESARLTAAEAEFADGFGADLAVEGGTLLVGAVNQNGNRGAAYVFRRAASGEWRQAARLVAEDGAAGDAFGASVALDGDVALVGAPGQASRTGAVYAFHRDGEGAWSAQGKLAADDAAAGDVFGAAVALEGGRALIGAPLKNGRGGAVYAFTLDAGRWREAGRLEAEGVQPADGFGSALALQGEAVWVGAPRRAESTGAVYTFRLDDASGEWRPSGRLVAFDGGSRYRFGTAIAPAEDAVWIGAPGAAGFRGAVYIFERDAASGAWRAVRRLAAAEPGRGDRFAGAVAVNGELAAVGLVGADHGAGTAVIYEAGAEAGQWTPRNTVLSEAEGLDPVVGGAVDCRDGQAAIFGCGNVELLSFLPISAIGGERGVNLNDIWGWTDPETGKEYALVGRVDGTAFVDISDPVNPVYVGQLLKPATSPSSAWRDIKVYEDHAFIVADGAGDHGMQVFDLTRLREFEGEPVTFEPDAHYTRIHSAHNIAINTATGFAYPIGSSSGGETCGGGLHMIDIHDPENPTFTGCFADPQTGRSGTGYSHDAQCVIYHGPDADYEGREICLGFNETAISIADVTDKADPVAVARVSYPNVGYTHQGWLTEDHRYLYVDDELDELSGNVPATRTLIWDLAELEDPQLVAEHLGTTASSDHNLYIRGDLMYQSNYASGLRILDISDIAKPVEIGYLDVAPFGENVAGFTGSWSNYPFFESGVIAVTGIEQGLFLVRVKSGRPTS